VKPEYRDDRFQQFNALTSEVIAAAMRVHSELGPGLYEDIYHKCPLLELRESGLTVESEVPIPVMYRGKLIGDHAYKLDLLVDDTVILELKSVEAILPLHKLQLSTYLKLAGKPLGLLVNFNVERLRKGISRIVNPRWQPEAR